MKFALILAVALSSFLANSAPAQVAGEIARVGRALTEDQIFDAHREEPIAMLRKLYEEKRVLVLGYPSHSNATPYLLLQALLEKIGRDPRLKYVVLERSYFSGAALLEDGSVRDIPETELRRKFPVEQDGKEVSSTPCLHEYSYQWGKLLPQIRALNARRPAGQKLLVTSVDNGHPNTRMVESFSREFGTSVRFRQVIWDGLAASEKAVVMYNVGHVAKQIAEPVWLRGPKPLEPAGGTWLSMFLHQHPDAEAKMGVVLLDHVSDSTDRSSYNEGVLKFTQRQATRYPGQSFGVRLAPFRSVATERGPDVFSHKKHLVPAATALLPDIFDAVVWRANGAHERYKPGHVYLPTACALNHYTRYRQEERKVLLGAGLRKEINLTEAQEKEFEVPSQVYSSASDALTESLGVGERTPAGTQQVLALLVQELGSFRALLTPEQQAVFDPKMRAWIKQRELEGFRVAIPGVAP